MWPAGFSYPSLAALPLVFVPVPEPKATRNQVHLGLATRSAEHQQSEVRRPLALGATHADVGRATCRGPCLPTPELASDQQAALRRFRPAGGARCPLRYLYPDGAHAHPMITKVFRLI